MTSAPADLLAFVERGPSPFHAVAAMAERLDAAGYLAVDEREAWKLAAGDRCYVIRDGGSIVAFAVGAQPPADAGFRLIGAHTDSPTFRVRPQPDVIRHGHRLVGVEPYGGALTYTWLDRDLTLAGRLAVAEDGLVTTRLVHLPGAWLRIPSLAIHLNRALHQDGLKLDPQQHLVPLWGPAHGPDLVAAVAEHAGVDPAAVLAWDLVAADTQPPALGGADDTYLLAPRLDNLASCHAGLTALLAHTGGDATAVLVANDHEEVGSASAEGAQGSLLDDVLARIVAATDGGPQDAHRARARSRLVSADMAHAVHPNYADRHEPGHQPRLGGGPVIKHNANQSYATDAGSAGWFTARCHDVGVPVQHFVTRADLPCGSTIGPLTATRLGIPTVDVGNPVLSMHSIREQAAVADIDPMIRALTAHLDAPDH
ncbi:MAG TPA: M18 family aminopeptidase [Egibacteraceae bacterium]|nr:M18 family aminopeptidase [Egibacteraceae bacterium]